MNILIIPSWYYDQDSPISGIFFKEQAQALAAIKEVEVGLMYGKFDWRESLFSQVSSDRTDGFLTLRGKAWAPPKVTRLGLQIWLSRYLALFEVYKEQAGLPELIHAHSWVAGIVAERLKKEYNIPYLLTEHLSRVNKRKLTPRQSRLAKRAYRGADQLIAVSHGLASSMKELTGTKPVKVIPNSVDTSFFKCSERNIAQRPLILLSIGHPWRRKGHDLLLGAAVQLRRLGCDVQVLIGGITATEVSIPTDIQKEMGGNLKILGMMSRDAVKKAICESSIYVSASRTEPFGVTIIEALSCGKPVVASRTAGGRNILEGNRYLGETFEVGNTGQLVKMLQYMIANLPSYDAQMIRKHTIDHYSQGVIANETVQLYRKVLGG